MSAKRRASDARSSPSPRPFQRSPTPEIHYMKPPISRQPSQKSSRQFKQTTLSISKPVDEHNPASKLASNTADKQKKKSLPSKEVYDLIADGSYIPTKSPREVETQQDLRDTATKKQRLIPSHESPSDDRSHHLDEYTSSREQPKKRRYRTDNKSTPRKPEPSTYPYGVRDGCDMSASGRCVCVKCVKERAGP
ncbi:hypothetical protein BDZ45DRAFT_806437 [Acephala macrosclerotiorum]|nr:hypothetical protein BDZ45DRAFT_806437 [Acephala macrosclerotiorum]